MIYNINGISFKNIYLYTKSLYQDGYQELAAVMKTVPEIGFYTFNTTDNVISPDDVKPYSIMIFDDLSNVESMKSVCSYYCYGRHKNVDCFFLADSYSQIPKRFVFFVILSESTSQLKSNFSLIFLNRLLRGMYFFQHQTKKKNL